VHLTEAQGHELLRAGGEAPDAGLLVPDHPRDVARLHPGADQLGELQLADAPQDLEQRHTQVTSGVCFINLRIALILRVMMTNISNNQFHILYYFEIVCSSL